MPGVVENRGGRHASRHAAVTWIFLFMAGTVAAQPPSWLDPARVLVVYSTTFPDNDGNSVPDSLEVALAYQAKRGVPASNLIGVACSTTGDTYTGTNAWSLFKNEVRDPVVLALSMLGATTIDTLVFCHGVPYRLFFPNDPPGLRCIDQAMRTPFFLSSPTTPPFPTAWYVSPYFEASPGFATDQGHFAHGMGFAGAPFYLVARLDGPDVNAALDLIEGARYGDLYLAAAPGHYQGTIYLDTRFSAYQNASSLPYPQLHGPSYANADEDMAYVAQSIFTYGFPVLWENTATDLEIGQPGAMFHTGAPALLAPNALFYYGWYNFATYHDVYEWLPGSAASDLNSDSLSQVRSSAPSSFLSSAFRRGLTAGVGAIGEPFLNGHPFPEVFIRYLLDGYTFAEAAAVCDPTLLWRSIAVGDPLYCPLRPGKPSILDQVAPPVPSVRPVAATGSEATFELALETTGREPDMAVVHGAYGRAPVLDQVLPPSRPYRLRPRATLAGLVPGAFYRAALSVTDPANLTTPAPEILFINDGGTGPAAVVQASAASVPASQPFGIELAIRVPGGLASLFSLAFTLDLPQLGLTGIDLLPAFLLLPHALHGTTFADPMYSLEVSIPGALAPGTYMINLAGVTASGPFHASATVVVN